MGRLRTLLRLVREKNWVELRAALERSTFPRGLFFVNRLTFCRLRELKAPKLSLSHIEVRTATPDDTPLLQQCRYNARGYDTLFATGDTCFLAVAGDDGVAFGWAETRDVHVSAPNGYTFELGPNAAWTYAIEVNPAYRLKGGLVKLWCEMFDRLHATGVDAIYTSMPEHENVISFRSHKRLGFEPFARFAVYRILGMTRYRVEYDDGRTESGWGSWEGRDPSRNAGR